MPLPPKGERAICRSCHRQFYMKDDLGFFTYTVEIYVPVEQLPDHEEH